MFICVGNGTDFIDRTNVYYGFSRQSPVFNYSTFSSYPRLVGDFNGNGYGDLVAFRDDGLYASYWQGIG